MVCPPPDQAAGARYQAENGEVNGERTTPDTGRRGASSIRTPVSPPSSCHATGTGPARGASSLRPVHRLTASPRANTPGRIGTLQLPAGRTTPCQARHASTAHQGPLNRPGHTTLSKRGTRTRPNKGCAPRTSRSASRCWPAMTSSPGNADTGRHTPSSQHPQAAAGTLQGTYHPGTRAACRPTQTAPATRMHRQAPNQTAPAGAQPNCTGWADCPTNNLTLNIEYMF